MAGGSSCRRSPTPLLFFFSFVRPSSSVFSRQDACCSGMAQASVELLVVLRFREFRPDLELLWGWCRGLGAEGRHGWEILTPSSRSEVLSGWVLLRWGSWGVWGRCQSSPPVFNSIILGLLEILTVAGCWILEVYGSWSVEGCGRDPYLQRVGGGLVPVWLDLWFFCRVGLSVVCGDEQLCRLLCGLEARCAAVMWWRVGCSRRV